MSRSDSELLEDLRAVGRRYAAGDDEALIAFPDLTRELLTLAHPGPAATDAEKEDYRLLWDTVIGMIDDVVKARWAAPGFT